MNTERNKNIAIELAREIEKRINENLKVNIDDATIISGYSKRQIQNIFKSATGLNIGKYIRKRILTKAAILVKLTKKKIFHIAMDLHFSTQQHFNKAFIREFNCTPLEYRNSLYMDCSKLTPDFSVDIPEYTLVKTEIKSFKLKMNLPALRVVRVLDRIAANRGYLVIVGSKAAIISSWGEAVSASNRLNPSSVFSIRR